MFRMHDLDFAMKTTQMESVLLYLPSYELKNIEYECYSLFINDSIALIKTLKSRN